MKDISIGEIFFNVGMILFIITLVTFIFWFVLTEITNCKPRHNEQPKAVAEINQCMFGRAN